MDTRVVLAVLIVLAIVAILFAFFGRRGSPPPIREVIVREEVVPVAWLPWSWGYGWGGWRGTTYVDRPFPRFPWRPRDRGHGGGGHPPPPPPPAGGSGDGGKEQGGRGGPGRH